MLEKIWAGRLPNYKEKLKHVGEVLYICLDLLWIIIANYNFPLKNYNDRHCDPIAFMIFKEHFDLFMIF